MVHAIHCLWAFAHARLFILVLASLLSAPLTSFLLSSLHTSDLDLSLLHPKLRISCYGPQTLGNGWSRETSQEEQGW